MTEVTDNKGMRYLFLFLSFPLWAQTGTEQYRPQIVSEEKQESGQKELLFQAISEDQEFKPIVEGYFQESPYSDVAEILRLPRLERETQLEKFGNYLDDVVGQDSEKVQRVLEKVLKLKERAPAQVEGSNKVKKSKAKQTLNAIENLQYEVKLPAHLQKLADHLKKKLDEGIYGAEGERVANHSLFYQLYHSQLGKNLIQIVASYCLEADEEFQVPKNKDELTKNREENIKNLNIKIATDGGEIPRSYQHFFGCMQSLSLIADPKKAPANDREKFQNFPAESQRRAKIVVANIERLRDGLVQVERTQDSLRDHEENDSAFQYDIDPKKIYQGRSNLDQKTVDDLSSITSGEYLTAKGDEGGSLSDLTQADREELEDCKTNPNKCQDRLKDEEDLEEFAKFQKEFDSRTIAMASQIENFTKDDFERIYKEEKRDQKALEAENWSDEDLQAAIAEYKKEFRDKRQNIIQEMREKVRAATALEGEDPQQAIQKSKEQLEQETLGFTQLVHYSNIVSGYFQVEGSDTRNIESLRRELDQTAYDEDVEVNQSLREDLVSGLDDYFEELKVSHRDARGPAENQKNRNLNQFTVEDINDYILHPDEREE